MGALDLVVWYALKSTAIGAYSCYIVYMIIKVYSFLFILATNCESLNATKSYTWLLGGITQLQNKDTCK